MQYVVIAPDGTQFGPVDHATLQDWAMQGRVVPTTRIVRSDGLHISAGAIPGLGFPAGAVAPSAIPGFDRGTAAGSNPAATPQNGYASDQASNPWTRRHSWLLGASYTCAGLSFFCIPMVPALIGTILAAIAWSRGERAAIPAFVVNIAALVLTGVAFYTMVGMYSPR